MYRLWAQPLRRQLFIAIGLLLLPVLAAAAWSGWSTLKERESDLASLDRMAGNIALNPYVLALDATQSLTFLTSPAANRPSIPDVWTRSFMIGYRSAPAGGAVFHFELPAVAPGAA